MCLGPCPQAADLLSPDLHVMDLTSASETTSRRDLLDGIHTLSEVRVQRSLLAVVKDLQAAAALMGPGVLHSDVGSP